MGSVWHPTGNTTGSLSPHRHRRSGRHHRWSPCSSRLDHAPPSQRPTSPNGPGCLTWPGLAQRRERRPDFGGEQLGLFPGGEVTAFAGFVEVREGGVGLLYPAARGAEDLAGEGGEADRARDLRGGWPAAAAAARPLWGLGKVQVLRSRGVPTAAPASWALAGPRSTYATPTAMTAPATGPTR